jgi:geranyl-CoA carboxylase alpha subunit
LKLEAGGAPLSRSVTVLGPRHYRIDGDAGALEIRIADDGGGSVRATIEGREEKAFHLFVGDTLHLKCGARDFAVRETLYTPRSVGGATGASDTELRAPMNGKVAAVLVAEGDTVTKGQRLVVVEAMKMQHEMTAQASGRVVRLAVKAGDQVANRQLLVELAPAER